MARGRRRPELAIELNTANAQFSDPQDAVDLEEEFVLLPGDVMIAKTSIMYHTALGEAWSTFGVQTRVDENEDGDSAFGRLVASVNDGVTALAEDAVEHVNEIVARRRAQEAESPRGRIVPRHRG